MFGSPLSHTKCKASYDAVLYRGLQLYTQVMTSELLLDIGFRLFRLSSGLETRRFSTRVLKQNHVHLPPFLHALRRPWPRQLSFSSVLLSMLANA